MPLGRAALDFRVQPKGSTVQGCRAWPADATELATILRLARAAWGRGGLSKAYGADGRYRAQAPCRSAYRESLVCRFNCTVASTAVTL
jgi:hypothetical protein